MSLQSGVHYVYPLNGQHRACLESNVEPTMQPSLPIKAGQVHPQAGSAGAWANHHQEPKLPVDPSPDPDVDLFLSRSILSSPLLHVIGILGRQHISKSIIRGLSRSSSLPVAVKRKNSLVEVFRYRISFMSCIGMGGGGVHKQLITKIQGAAKGEGWVVSFQL